MFKQRAEKASGSKPVIEILTSVTKNSLLQHLRHYFRKTNIWIRFAVHKVFLLRKRIE